MEKEQIEGFRLSPQQKQVWELQRGALNLPYRAQGVVRIEGHLDTKTLKAALAQVTHRHEILRTTFQCLPGMSLPLQVITDGGMEWGQGIELSGLVPEEQEARAAALLREAHRAPFAFDNGPLLRVSLLPLSPVEHLLLLTLPALCADRTTLTMLVRDLSRSYTAHLRGEELADEPLQYADVAEWQNTILETRDEKIERDYWQGQDLSALCTLQLPFEKPGAEGKGFDPDWLPVTIPAEVEAKINALVQRYDTSLSAFLLACWQVELWRLSGQSDRIVGVACDGRRYAELERVLGPLTRYVPLQSHLEETLPFGTLLRQVREAAGDAHEWQESFSWEQVVGPVADGGGPPFFPCTFEFVEQKVKYTGGEVTFSLD